MDSLYLDAMFRLKLRGWNILNVPLFTLRYARRFLRLVRASKYDCILIEKEIFPAFPAWLEAVFMSTNGVRKVLDYDDAIFHKYDNPRKLISWICDGKIARLVRSADATIVGNDYLYDYAVEHGAPCVVKIPTVVDGSRYDIRRPDRSHDTVRIGWIGSTPNAHHLKSIEPALVELTKRFSFELRIVGGSKIELDARISVRYLRWSETEEVKLLQELDIGIMPLYDGPWERGKCGLKIVQYMAASLPVVASGIGANCEIVRHGRTGYLANEQIEWISHLTKLCASATRRRRMGQVGRRRFEQYYSLESRTQQFAQVLGIEAIQQFSTRETR